MTIEFLAGSWRRNSEISEADPVGPVIVPIIEPVKQRDRVMKIERGKSQKNRGRGERETHAMRIRW
jgi:hypothetical protein